ncbi:FAD-dependent oxidoreductase [Legionella saoudiensis]|uniref:FAD-dependent oxidoreductase n=1 Tax=Legionella saoudiensis TaxID=1750561 RepID=UPI0007310DAE|nr:FAD-dependent oxidoreductase [Legionella saoudiensis]
MSKSADFLLIGGGLASAFAANVLRREGEAGKIIILCEEAFFPYFRMQIPKAFLLGKQKIEQLYIYDESYYQKNDIEIILQAKVRTLDTKNKRVKIKNGGEIDYKKLLIATGCSPKKLTIPGAKLEGVHYLRSIDDAEAIIYDMQAAKKVVIYGDSFITIELASTLSQKGIKVTVITHEFNTGNFKVCTEIAHFLVNNGVEVILGEKLTKIEGSSRVQSVTTNTGKNFSCDFIIVDMGLKPNTDFLNESGIELDTDKSIVVNQYMQTNIPDVYAAGDVVTFYDPIFEKFRKTRYGDTAIKQGKIAAANMTGARHYNRTASYLFFYAFGTAVIIIGDASDATELLIRGFPKEKNFANLYLKDNVLQGAILVGRPTTEIKAAESLIENHTNLASVKKQLTDISFPLEPLATQTLIALQGGGAFGAFECGVIKAMEESEIYPDIVAGISIGAFNAAIIAGNPGNATAALEAFWNDLALETLDIFDEQSRRFLSYLQAIIWGSPNFFHPRWLSQCMNISEPTINWTSFYDTSPIKKLLCKYVDFKNLNKSPVRLLVMAVNVETSEFETFDSYTDNLKPEHILASGSLPPAFPWTTIGGKHYWDGGIVTNTPLDSALEICGWSGKKVYVVDVYPKKRGLPTNIIEVLSRKNEILFAEKMRKDFRTQDLIGDYKKLIELILAYCESDAVKEITELPLFIQIMGDLGVLSVTRIMLATEQEGLYSWDSDFSRKTIEELKEKGYNTAKQILNKE